MLGGEDRLADEIGANDVTSPAASATAVNTTALAAYTVPRRGITVREVLIMPVEYSEVIVSAPSTAITSWPRISPNMLNSVARDLILIASWACTTAGCEA